MSLPPLQCEEITSNCSEFSASSSSSNSVVVTVSNVEKAGELLRQLARQAISNGHSKKVAYTSEPGSTTVIKVGVGKNVIKVTNNGGGMVAVGCNFLPNNFEFTQIEFLFVTSVLVDEILKLFDYKVTKFLAKSDQLLPGYPKRQICCEFFRFESSDVTCVHVVDTWIRHVESVRKLHVGKVMDRADYARCVRVYETHFRGRVACWQSSHLVLPILNRLRRELPGIRIHDSLLPVAYVFRWIKGWMQGNAGFSHLTDISYRHRKLNFHRGVFPVFFNTRPVPDDAIIVKNVWGRRAVVRVERGGVEFRVEPDGFADSTDGDGCADPRLRELFSNGTPVPGYYHNYPNEDLVDSDARIPAQLERDFKYNHIHQQYATLK